MFIIYKALKPQDVFSKRNIQKTGSVLILLGNYKEYYLAKSQKLKAEVSKQVAIMFAKQTFAP